MARGLLLGMVVGALLRGLADGSALLLAIEEWLTPDGDSSWPKGIAPQVPVAMPDEAEGLFPRTEREMTEQQSAPSSDGHLLWALDLLQQSVKNK